MPKFDFGWNPTPASAFGLDFRPFGPQTSAPSAPCCPPSTTISPNTGAARIHTEWRAIVRSIGVTRNLSWRGHSSWGSTPGGVARNLFWEGIKVFWGCINFNTRVQLPFDVIFTHKKFTWTDFGRVYIPRSLLATPLSTLDLWMAAVSLPARFGAEKKIGAVFLLNILFWHLGEAIVPLPLPIATPVVLRRRYAAPL